jgi:FkbM family methyltransferase
MSKPAAADRRDARTAPGTAAPSDPATLRRIAAELASAADDCAKQSHAANLDRVRDLRRQAAEHLLGLAQPDGPALAETVRAIVIACLRSDIRALTRSAADDDLFRRAEKAVQSASGSGATGPALAAILMAWHAFELASLPPPSVFPKELRGLWFALLLESPPAFAHKGDSERFAHYLERLCGAYIAQYLRANAGPVDDIAAEFSASTAFIQCYFNELNLRSLMRGRAAIIEDLVRRNGAALDQLRAALPCKTRPRIGFICHYLGEGTETAFLVAHMERLDRRRFDVRLYSVVQPTGKMGLLCRAAAEGYVQLPDNMAAAVARLRNENLDVAVFAANLTATLRLADVAAHRVATVQAASVASPVTTGLRNMDVLISGAPNETENAADHYTERLVSMPHALNCYAFPYLLEGLPPTDPVTRSMCGIPDDAVLFFSSANYYKILPELSEQWLSILAQVPNSYLLLMPFNPNWSNRYPVESFHERLRAQLAAAGVSADRLLVHPAVPSVAHLHRVMEMADVYLDAFPFSGACSIYDALAVGLPTVARAGAVCRSRHSTAILREEGLSDWVVNDGASYVERAVALGRDAARRIAERARADRCRRAGLRLTDTAAYGAMLMTTLDGIVSDWNTRVGALHALTPDALAQRIAALVPEAAEELGLFADRDLVLQVVLPYLRHGGSRRLIDVGACVGAMSEPFLAEGWQTVMFEPDQRCHPTLAALAEKHPGQVRVEAAAVTGDRDGSVRFHIAGSPGLSGLSRSPHAPDLTTLNVRALALAPYIARNGLFDVDFLKIDAEGHDFAILDGVDFTRIAPRLVMVEFGDTFEGQNRAAIEGALHRMGDRGYRACVVCQRALGDFAQHDWRTGLLVIGIDAVPALPAGMPLSGNILFFRAADGDFLPSLCDWLEQFGDRKRRGLLPLR